MVPITEMGHIYGRAGLKAEMEYNFVYIIFAISFVNQMKISGSYLLKSGSQGRNQN